MIAMKVRWFNNLAHSEGGVTFSVGGVFFSVRGVGKLWMGVNLFKIIGAQEVIHIYIIIFLDLKKMFVVQDFSWFDFIRMNVLDNYLENDYLDNINVWNFVIYQVFFYVKDKELWLNNSIAIYYFTLYFISIFKLATSF